MYYFFDKILCILKIKNSIMTYNTYSICLKPLNYLRWRLTGAKAGDGGGATVMARGSPDK